MNRSGQNASPPKSRNRARFNLRGRLALVVGVMSAGRVVQTGTPSEVYARPVDPFVASFVGTGTAVGAKVVAGTAMTVLGDLPVPGTPEGEVDLFLRPEQVTIDPTGATAATVTARDIDSACPPGRVPSKVASPGKHGRSP